MTFNTEDTIDFYILEEEVKTLCHFRISGFDVSEDDCSCLVLLSPLLKREKRIFGIDETQTVELAMEFATSMLSERKILNLEGESVELKQLVQIYNK